MTTILLLLFCQIYIVNWTTFWQIKIIFTIQKEKTRCPKVLKKTEGTNISIFYFYLFFISQKFRFIYPIYCHFLLITKSTEKNKNSFDDLSLFVFLKIFSYFFWSKKYLTLILFQFSSNFGKERIFRMFHFFNNFKKKKKEEKS